MKKKDLYAVWGIIVSGITIAFHYCPVKVDK